MSVAQAVIGWTLVLVTSVWNATVGLPKTALRVVCSTSQTVSETIAPVTDALRINR